MKLAGEEAPTLTIDGRSFRDLNKNGKLDIYKDSQAMIEDRVEIQLEDVPYVCKNPL